MPTSKAMQWFRAGTIVLGVTAVLHLLGHLLGSMKQPVHPDEIRLMELGTQHLIDFGGIQRTFMDLFNGFSLAITLLTAFLALMLHFLYDPCSTTPGLLRKVTGICLLFSLALFALSVLYLIWPPIFLFAITSGVFLFSWLGSLGENPI